MRAFGILLIASGIGTMVYALGMDTSVSTSDIGLPPALQSYAPSAMRVNNLGLMQKKQNLIIVGGFLAVVGAILTVSRANPKTETTSADVASRSGPEAGDSRFPRSEEELLEEQSETKAANMFLMRFFLVVAFLLVIAGVIAFNVSNTP